MRAVVVKTANSNKIPEFQHHLDLYNVKTLQEMDKSLSNEAIVSKYASKYNVIALVTETSLLVKRGTNQLAEQKTAELVDHVSLITIRHVKKDKLVEDSVEIKDGCVQRIKSVEELEARVEGYINLNKRDVECKFGFDDIFCVKGTHMSYMDFQSLNIKISARDIAFDKFVISRLKYSKLVNLVHNPQDRHRPIEFDTKQMHRMYCELIREYPQLNDLGVTAVIDAVYRNGVYYTAPDGLRIKLNWQPGVNGLPLTPKAKNKYHEITFGIHDKGHACFKPDLIAVSPSRLNYLLYIINRMISEAITLFFADGIFVSAVKDAYATLNEREIYPLFAELGLPLEREHLVTSVYKIMEANVFYFLLGDESYFNTLLAGRDSQSLRNYTRKFSEFAKGDYEWSKQNFDALMKQQAVQRNWYDTITALNQKFDLQLMSTEEFAEKLGLTEADAGDVPRLVRLAFEYIFEHNVKRFFTGEPVTAISENNLTKAFVRYMCNQVYIFEQFSFLTSASIYKDIIMSELLKLDEGTFTQADVNRLRLFYEQFLEELQQDKWITEDDFHTYKELYSITRPFFINYDKGTSETLPETVARILA